MHQLVAGVDLGGTKTAFAIADRKGRVLIRSVQSTPLLPPAKALPILIRRLDNLLTPLGAKLSAITIGAPALTDPATGELLWAPKLWSANGKGWLNVPLGKELRKHFHCPVQVENDVDMALLAEAWKGSAKGIRNAVMLTVGTGVGGALLFDGKLLQGAGAAGWMRVEGGECMEEIASGPAILRRFLKLNKGRWPFEGKPNTLKVCQAGLKGHPKAKRVLDDAAKALGWACAGLVSVLNPQVVILGGGVMDTASTFLIPRVRSQIKKLASPGASAKVRVIRSKLGNEAGCMGSLASALKTAGYTR